MDEKFTEDLFGVLTGRSFKLEPKVYRGSWDIEKDPIELMVTEAYGYKVHDWDEDERGGPGLLLYVEALTSKKKVITTQIIIPKDELIKALALLVEEE